MSVHYVLPDRIAPHGSPAERGGGVLTVSALWMRA